GRTHGRNRLSDRPLAPHPPVRCGSIASSGVPEGGGVRVWQITSRGSRPGTGRPPPDGVDVDYPLAGVPEPSTFLLSALRVGCLVVRRKWPRRATEAKRPVGA